MKERLFKITAYLFPLGLIALLSPILLAVIKIFGPSGILKKILGTLLYYDFNAFWYGGIPYLLFLATAYFIRSRLKHALLQYSHLYSPLLFSLIFFLFWIIVFEITGSPPVNLVLYLKTFLLPVSLYTGIGGYLYLSLAGLLYLRIEKSGKQQ